MSLFHTSNLEFIVPLFSLLGDKASYLPFLKFDFFSPFFKKAEPYLKQVK